MMFSSLTVGWPLGLMVVISARASEEVKVVSIGAFEEGREVVGIIIDGFDVALSLGLKVGRRVGRNVGGFEGGDDCCTLADGPSNKFSFSVGKLVGRNVGCFEGGNVC